MKRVVFRVSVLGVIVALGLLAIAHAQRTGSDVPPDDGSSNPLRGGQPVPGPSDVPANYRTDDAGPADSGPPSANPLRKRPAMADGNVRQASEEEPQGQGQQG